MAWLVAVDYSDGDWRAGDFADDGLLQEEVRAEGEAGRVDKNIHFACRRIDSVDVCHVVIHGELVLEVVFVGKDMDHPTEDHGHEGTAFGLAGFCGVDRSEHAELRMTAVVFLHLVCGSGAEVDVLMPARDAQRDTLVELVFTGACTVREHHTF